MKAVAYCLLLAFWCPVLPAENVTITIRLVNGKNGKPITNENLNVFFGDSGLAATCQPDKNGMSWFTVDSNAILDFDSNIGVTCHSYALNVQQRHYRVSEILDHGISDENICNKKIRVEARAGEFVYYERPRTFLEWWRWKGRSLLHPRWTPF